MPRSWLNPTVDRRKGDRHKPRKGHGGPGRSRWDKRNVVGWDGEGAEVDGVHVYNLLANSLGRYIRNDKGLSTVACFEFFLDCNSSSAINVVFSGGYDVNMILRDVPKDKIKTLWKDGRVHWNCYRITYRQRKVFSVAKQQHGKRQEYGKSFVLWDVFGFFQASFVKACRKWLVDDDTIETIDAMKQKRSEFTTDEFDTILRYCRQECDLLVLLVEELFKSLDSAGLQLRRFDGAGAIAGAMLRQNSVKQHIPKPPDDIYRAIQLAYAGGRIEAVQVGNHEGPVWKYDINSAYPSAMIQLPSWEGATWQTEQRPSSEGACIASLVAVEWSYTETQPLYPLFFRAHDGTILFPRTGTGIYWMSEFSNLQRYFREGEDYEVLYTINCYSPHPEVRPLEWVQEAYNTRLAFKRQGNMAQEAIKLGINSIYGKFAQQEGYVREVPGVRKERWPTYHCLAWASMATAATRSLMYSTSVAKADNVVAFATDAVITTTELDGVGVGDGLGQWSLERYDGCTVVQAGVYWLKDPDTGEWYSKYRGFDPDSLSRDAVLAAWGRGDTTLPVTLTRFVGMGSALNRTDFHSHWRHWETEDRTLDLIPKGKREAISTEFATRLCPTRPVDNMNPGWSRPYPVIWMDGYKGIPASEAPEGSLKMMEVEWEESYL